MEADALTVILAQEIEGTPRGGRGARIEAWARQIGVHPNTIRRRLIPAPHRPTGQPPAHAIPWVEALVRVKKCPPRATGRELSWRRAIALAIEHAMIPTEAREISESTWQRWSRALGILREDRRVVRWQAERPNEVHQFDVSQSRYFRVARQLPDGEVVLKLEPTGEYKNKPLGADRLRWWLYGLVDDHSGYRLGRATAALGENWGDAMAFLQWAWAPKAEPAVPVCGKPETLLLDNGPLAKSRITSELLPRLNVDLLTNAPGNPQAHGKVERPWRDAWYEWELGFFLAANHAGNYRSVEVGGAEYNQQLLAWLVERNELRHRSLLCTKREAWQAIAQHGGPVLIPEAAWETAIQPPVERQVGRDGCFHFETQRWQIKGLIEATVRVLKGALDGRVVAVDVATGVKYEAEPERMLAFGEYRGAKTPAGAGLRANPPAAGCTIGGEERSKVRTFESSGENGNGNGNGAAAARRVAAFRPRGRVLEGVADPRAGAVAGYGMDEVEVARRATAGGITKVGRYAIVELFRDGGVPAGAARAFVWSRVGPEERIAEAAAEALLAEFRGGARTAVGE